MRFGQLGLNHNVFCCQVSWLRRSGEKLDLVAVGLEAYTPDIRFIPSLRPPNDWQLRIESAQQTDQGIYECQVSSHPPIVQTYMLSVVGEYPENYIISYFRVHKSDRRIREIRSHHANKNRA
jgi:hypothetical protein